MISTSVSSVRATSILALGILSMSACAPLRLPYKSAGPAASRDGVEVAVRRQSCTQNVDPDFYGDDLVEEVVEVQIRNPTSKSLTVQRDAFRLANRPRRHRVCLGLRHFQRRHRHSRRRHRRGHQYPG